MNLFLYKLIHHKTLNEILTKTKYIENEMKNATSFIKSIEDGLLDAEYEGVDENKSLDTNTLSGSLLSMRSQMKAVAEQERERNWATEGLAKFVEILRSNNEDLDVLSDKILSNLVKYLNANQGYLYVVDETNPNDPYLGLVSCYAYNKKKFVEKRVEIGEGLLGQCYLEKDTIYITDLPLNYVTITSGIGEATPRNTVLVPLKLNDSIYGVVEMASFEPIKKYQIEFLEKLGESIASTIANVKVNERTKMLLSEAQKMTEQLRAQEEETRQNMEELTSTQEEMKRKQAEVSELIEKFNLVTSTTTEGLWDMTIPENMEFTDNTPFNWSDKFRQMLGYSTEREFPNVLHSWSDLLHVDQKENTLNAFTAHLVDFSGKTPYDVEYQLLLRDGTYRWFRAVGNTLRNENGRPLRVAGSLIDIQAIKEMQKLKDELEAKVSERTAEMESVLQAAQVQNEELKAQEEELRQNMEELQSTQEEMERKTREINSASAEMKGILEGINSTMATIEFSPEGKIVGANANFLKVMKYSLKDIVGKHHSLFVPKEISDSEGYGSFWIDLANGKSNAGIFKRLDSKGNIVWLNAIYNPILDVDGNVTKVVKFASDITLEKHRELEIQDLVEKFTLVTRTSTEGLWDMVVPASMEFTDDTPFSWSDRFREMLGYLNEKDFPNVLHSWSDLLHPDHKQQTLAAFTDHLLDFSGNTPYDVQYKLKLKNGTYRWFRAVGNTLRDEKGTPKRVAGSLIDIQALKDLELGANMN